jgi:cell division protein FtsI/penicillin-binding protein 2
MRRRDFCALLLPASQLSTAGTALLVSVGSRQIIYNENARIADQWLIRPGSTVKPFTLFALIRAGKLSPLDAYPCPGALSIQGQNLNCSHPKLALPMNAARSLAYSCNCAIAHFAARLRPGELRQTLRLFGFTHMEDPASLDAQKLQAIGQDGLWTTPLQLLEAYRELALRIQDPLLQPILEGLEGAANYGTAQRARLNRIQIAGKTGSVETSPGVHAALFAGFAPSRKPEVAAVVVTQGLSGGADAAPIAQKLLRDYYKDRA